MKTILVVDDNKPNLASARDALQDAYKVIPVTKGRQALTYLEDGECDIILLDIDMPDMSGFELLELIRAMEKWRGVPVIFLTDDGDTGTEALCFQRGAVDFIAKPFAPEAVRSRVGRILELEELRRTLTVRLEEKNREVSDIRSKIHQDALTGLWNRIYTEEKVNGLLEHGSSGALMMIDIDNFKEVNDNYGHIAGDMVLQMFADVLRNGSSKEDILCRIGGDEFVAFIKDVNSKAALSERAGTFIAEFSRRIKETGMETHSSISVGIAQMPNDGKNFIELYGNADKALYYVKQNGKDAYHFYSDQMEASKSRAGRTVDLKYVQDLMSRGDSGVGVYLMDFESFHHVYNFIRRFVERSNRDVQTVLLTVSEGDNKALDASEAEFALEVLEKAVYTSLRRSDVSTRYSSKQLIVILMDASNEYGDMVAERIIGNFYKLYTGKKVQVDYGIARIEAREKK